MLCSAIGTYERHLAWILTQVLEQHHEATGLERMGERSCFLPLSLMARSLHHFTVC